MDAALNPRAAGSGREVGELDQHAGSGLVERDERVVAGRAHDTGRDLLDPGHAGRAGREHPQRLGDERRARDALEIAEVVAEDVGVVDAHVERDRAGLAQTWRQGLTMTRVVAADVRL